jgi:PAS domain S-box-containing protein
MRVNVRPVYAVVALALLAVIAIAGSITLFLWDLRGRELAHSRAETVSLNKMFMAQTQQSLESTDGVLIGLQERLQTPFGRSVSLDSSAIHLLLASRVSGGPQIHALFLVNPEGRVVNSSRQGEVAAISVEDRAYFRQLRDGGAQGLFIDKPVHNRLNGSWTLYLSRRLNDPAGQFRGVVVAAFDLSRLEQSFSNLMMDVARPIALYLSDGTLLASLPHREHMMASLAPELNHETLPTAEQGVKLITHSSGDGSQAVLAIGRLKTFPLLVSVTNDEVLSLASWRETAVRIGLGAGLVTLFIVIVAASLLGELRREERLSVELSEATDRYQHTVDSVMDAIVAIDAQQKIVLFNPAAERMFVRHAHDTLGKPLSVLMPQRMRPQHGAHVGQFNHSAGLSRTMAPQLEIVGIRSDGVEFPIESTISKTLIGGKVQMTAVLRDVSEHRRNEAELRKMNLQLRELSNALQEVREVERSRIARELHDELGQKLTGLKLDLSWLGSRLKEGREADPNKVDEMRHLLDETIASVRRISTELRPLILDDLGLGEAIAWQAREVTKRSGLTIELDLPAASMVRHDALATALFRIVQESMTNAVRHAHATHMNIRLTADADALKLQVQDNGVGFDAQVKSPGIGLVSMRERAVAMGGDFRMVSAPGRGVSITVLLP